MSWCLFVLRSPSLDLPPEGWFSVSWGVTFLHCAHTQGKCWSEEDPSSFGWWGRFPSHRVCVPRGLPLPAWSVLPLISSSLSPGLLLACSVWVRATLGLGAEWWTAGLVVLTVMVFFIIRLLLFPFLGPNLAAPCILSRVYSCIRDSERAGVLIQSSLEQSSPVHLSMCAYMSSTCSTTWHVTYLVACVCLQVVCGSSYPCKYFASKKM